MKVVHIPCASCADPIPTLETNLSVLDPTKSYAVVATAQHLHTIDSVVSFLSSHGIICRSCGQVLGCDQSNARGKEDAVLYIGSGRFHPIGIAQTLKKPVFILNPISHVLDMVDEKDIIRYEKKRKGAIAKALDSTRFGIMISAKSGQKNIELALRLKTLLESHKKQAWLFAAAELSPPNLLPFKCDMLVNTACPRIPGDEYHVPVISASDLEAAMALLDQI